MTLEETYRNVSGILQHPAFGDARKDVVVVPNVRTGTVSVHGPQKLLDGFLRALENSGLEVTRPAPATLVIAYQ